MIEINPGFDETVLLKDGRMCDSHFRRYRMAWENHPKFNIVNWVPIHLDLETTARCQLKCPGCPSTKLKFDKGDMNLTTASKLIADFGALGGSSVKFNWRGEPTLYPGLSTLVDHAKNMGLVDIGINTNGVALTPKLSRSLIESGITMVSFSIDSFDAERYASLRPGAKLPKVLLNLRAFLHEAEKAHNLYVRVQRIAYPGEPVPHEEFVEYFKDNFPRINAVASNRYKEKELVGNLSVPSRPCAQLWQRLVVTHDGWMGPCCEFNRFNLDRFGRYPNASVRDVWNSLELTQLRKFHLDGRQNEVNACSRCTVTKVIP